MATNNCYQILMDRGMGPTPPKCTIKIKGPRLIKKFNDFYQKQNWNFISILKKYMNVYSSSFNMQ